MRKSTGYSLHISWESIIHFEVRYTLIIECLLFVIGVFHPCCSGFLVKRVINGELGERKVAISKYTHTHTYTHTGSIAGLI